jgi:hypothetical protein
MHCLKNISGEDVTTAAHITMMLGGLLLYQNVGKIIDDSCALLEKLNCQVRKKFSLGMDILCI